MVEEKKDIFKNFIKKCKKNPWMPISGLLFILLIVVAFVPFGNVTATSAGESVIAFAEAQGITAELVSVESNGGFYDVILSIEGNDIPVKVTKDGKYLAQITPLQVVTGAATNNPTSVDVPKSNKPVVELFIWSYCPYGVQAQGPLAEVALLLGDYADFNIVPYYDGHGPFETQQNKIQSCIQELDKNKYWKYAAGFVENIYPKCSSTSDVECDSLESVKLMKSLGIDDSKVMSCVDSKGDSLLTMASSLAQQYGVSGSPTLIINGVKVNVARNAESYKTAVCEAFSNAPSECSEVLNSDSAAAAGSC